MKLSVTVITLNEERYLPLCLESVKNIADEIVVVDSGSTDKTIEIAKIFGAKVLYRKFDNYANQKNFAQSKTEGDWILSLDADEEIEDALANEIKLILKTKDIKYSAYSIPRKNYIFGKFIKHTRWQPELDRHVWLWKSNSGKWIGDVHEEVIVTGNVGKLKYSKIHHQYENISEFLEMINSYSKIEAEYLYQKGVRFSFLSMLIQPKYNFLVRFNYRLGFLDGWRGFVLSYLMAIYHFVLWAKLWNLNREILLMGKKDIK